MGVSFETCLRRRGDVLMGRHHYVPMRCNHSIPIRRREDVPLRGLGDVPLRRCWVFHLRRTCDVTETYRETSLRRRHDVLLPGGFSIKMPGRATPIFLRFFVTSMNSKSDVEING